MPKIMVVVMMDINLILLFYPFYYEFLYRTYFVFFFLYFSKRTYFNDHIYNVTYLN